MYMYPCFTSSLKHMYVYVPMFCFLFKTFKTKLHTASIYYPKPSRVYSLRIRLFYKIIIVINFGKLHRDTTLMVNPLSLCHLLHPLQDRSQAGSRCTVVMSLVTFDLKQSLSLCLWLHSVFEEYRHPSPAPFKPECYFSGSFDVSSRLDSNHGFLAGLHRSGITSSAITPGGTRGSALVWD